jgi:hypothetical protein
MDRLLPSVKYVTAPSPEIGRRLGEEVIRNAPSRIGGLAVAKTILDQQGWRLRYSRTFPEKSTVESLLIPLRTGGFSVVLNPLRLPDDADERTRHEAFLLGHEIAHSFFYTDEPGVLPHRISGQLATPEEESFCDEFGRPFGEL